MNKNEFIRYYTTPRNPGAFSGFENVVRELKKQKIEFNKNKIKEWIQSLNPYTRHRYVSKKSKGSKIMAYGIDDLWHVDLIDMQAHAKINKGFNYILTCIDVFSKFAWAILLKDKSADSVYFAFDKIFKSELSSKNISDSNKKFRLPKRIQSDHGKEFLNKQVMDLFKKNNISFYQTASYNKACVVERFNRTLKEKMWRYFTHKEYRTNEMVKYYDIIDDLVESYNNSRHRSIKMAPREVNIDNEDDVFINLYGYSKSEGDTSFIKLKFKVNDYVKIQREKKTFEKGYTPTWKRETFRIYCVLLRNPPLYKIEAFDGKIADASYGEQDLQKVTISPIDIKNWEKKKQNYLEFEKNTKAKYPNISDSELLKMFYEKFKIIDSEDEHEDDSTIVNNKNYDSDRGDDISGSEEISEDDEHYGTIKRRLNLPRNVKRLR
jgi:hypothetical protein